MNWQADWHLLDPDLQEPALKLAATGRLRASSNASSAGPSRCKNSRNRSGSTSGAQIRPQTAAHCCTARAAPHAARNWLLPWS
jgi:hypothetical protein